MKRRLLCITIFCYGCGSGQSDQKEIAETVTATQIRPGVANLSGLQIIEEKDGNGKVTSVGFYLNGKKEGSWTTYFSGGGAIRTLTTYIQDKKEGWYLEFGENNSLTKRIMYHEDQRHGEYKEFVYAAVREHRNYQNGKQDGVTKVFYDTGKLMEEGLYKNGVREGISKWYDQEGNVTIEYEYKDGQLVKK